MIAVVVGDIDRSSTRDKQDVNKLLDSLKTRYRDLIIVSAACERGIGHIVRSRCLQKPKAPEFSFIEVSIKPWATIPKDQLNHIYTAKNATLEELGEEFFIFSSGWQQGHIIDLINRVKAKKMPLVVYDRKGVPEAYNFIFPDLAKDEDDFEVRESLRSSDLKGALE